MTSDTARLYGLRDRGLLAPGYKADLNVIDFERLRLHLPEVAHDLPTGAMAHLDRFLTAAEGRGATFRQAFPASCLPMVRGERVASLDPYTSDAHA